MKKFLLPPLAVIAMMVSSALAQNGTAVVDFTQSATSVNSGQTFTVTFQLQSGVNPTLAVVSSFDLFLESNSANVDNNFSIVLPVTYPAAGTQSGNPSYPDTISSSTSDHSGYAQNQYSQGYSFTNDLAVSNPTNLVTLTIQVGANTPIGSYTFFNTSSSDTKATLIGGGPDASNDLNQYDVNQASFTIDVIGATVPEPSTWLAGVGASGVIGYTVLRRRKMA